MPRSAIVTLAGRDYTITELPSRKNAEWRAGLAGPFAELSDLLGNWRDTPFTGDGISALIKTLSGLFLGSADRLVALLFAYSAELERDRERIQEEAYDSEIMEALIEVFKLAYPFASMAQRLGGLMTGPAKPTSPSSPVPAGDSGTTS